MTDKKKDLRFRKTELSIRAAFFELLKSRRISEITVAEISRKAMLGQRHPWPSGHPWERICRSHWKYYWRVLSHRAGGEYFGTHGKTVPLHHRPRRTAPPSLPPHFHTKLHRPPDYPPTLRIQPSGGRRGLWCCVQCGGNVFHDFRVCRCYPWLLVLRLSSSVRKRNHP